ncbi:hypothetical protein H6P81_019428 [Aristolochia fimbriata]|uniref:60S ribosomal protein L37a n=1 Tax=Aristolochia fimbriata TaxID=158543 RepID=A0AAV7DWB9_ARIFI|nr:hypothetical protein H6P81_019428 [Aristolochia fimbriata]
MTKRTKKAGIVGKYGTRYGASLRKQIKKMEVSQHAKYFCEFCGKYAVKRKAVGIWGCKDCGKVKAGGAYTLNTASAVTISIALELDSILIVTLKLKAGKLVAYNIRKICLLICVFQDVTIGTMYHFNQNSKLEAGKRVAYDIRNTPLFVLFRLESPCWADLVALKHKKKRDRVRPSLKVEAV